MNKSEIDKLIDISNKIAEILVKLERMLEIKEKHNEK